MPTALSTDERIQPNAELRRLVQEAQNAPTQNAPRLALAEWLETHAADDSDRERAEFIRLQTVSAGMNRQNPELLPMLLRQAALLRAHRAEWLRADMPSYGRPGQPNVAHFERGLPEFSTVGNTRTALERVQAKIDEVPLDEHYFRNLEYTLAECWATRGVGPTTETSPHLARKFIEAGLTVADNQDAWMNYVAFCMQRPQYRSSYVSPELMPPLMEFLISQGLEPNRLANIRLHDLFEAEGMDAVPTTPSSLFSLMANPYYVSHLNQTEWRTGWENLLHTLVSHGMRFGEAEQRRLESLTENYPLSPGLIDQLRGLQSSSPQSNVTAQAVQEQQLGTDAQLTRHRLNRLLPP